MLESENVYIKLKSVRKFEGEIIVFKKILLIVIFY